MVRKRKRPGMGKKFSFHGDFHKKSDAVKKERKVKGSFIHPTKVRGHKVFLVLKPRKKK